MKNNTIALLIGVLIVISLASFFVGPRNVFFVTGGAATGEGSTSFNLTEEVSILVAGTMNFGSGRVDANSSSSILDSALGKYNYYMTNITAEVTDSPPIGIVGMIFDSGRGVYVALRTDTSLIMQNETWEFNYSNYKWTNVTNTTFPTGGATDYDSDARQMVSFGGKVEGIESNYSFQYNGTSWTLIDAPDVAPEPTHSASMVYDSARKVHVLFGGNDKDEVSLFETWEYNYTANNWTNKTGVIHPPKNVDFSMVFVPGFNRVVYYRETQTWEYDGTDWTNVTSSSKPKPVTASNVFSYDSQRQKIIRIGGYSGNPETFTPEIWDYDYNERIWHRIYDTSYKPFWNGGITSVWGSLSSFDSWHNVTVLFGGTPDLVNWDAETWVYNYSLSGGGSNGSWFPYKDYFFVENDGTVNISVNYSANKNAAQFIGGTSPSFQIKGVADEANACSDLNTTYAEMPNATEAPNVLCPVLKYQNDADIFRVATKVVVPSDVKGGEKSSTITFTAAKV